MSIKFFWINEPSEIYAAATVEAALEHFSDETGGDAPESHGEVDGNVVMKLRDDCTGEVTERSLIDHLGDDETPCLVATGY